MKKSRGLLATLVPLFMVGVGLLFWPGTAAFGDDRRSDSQHESPSSGNERDHDSDHHDDHDGDHHDEHDGDHRGGHEDEGDKCIVCHNPHNFHEISIPCDQVDKFLRDHPGDFRGHCSTTPNTNK
jgi:hypothetical protein